MTFENAYRLVTDRNHGLESQLSKWRGGPHGPPDRLWPDECQNHGFLRAISAFDLGAEGRIGAVEQIG